MKRLNFCVWSNCECCLEIDDCFTYDKRDCLAYFSDEDDVG